MIQPCIYEPDNTEGLFDDLGDDIGLWFPTDDRRISNHRKLDCHIARRKFSQTRKAGK
jgi:hypothetical protein